MRRAAASMTAAAMPFCGCSRDRKRPNIVFILTDDQRWDALGAAGNAVIQTPQLDRLAADGCLFRNAFVTTAICMASRASIFTGLYERKHGCNFNTGDLKPAFWDKSYPVLLRRAGYFTGFIGKFGFAVMDVPRERNIINRAWNDINNIPHGDFDVWHGFPGQGRYFPEGPEGRHLTRIMTDQAIGFFKSAPRDKPFCLSVSFKAPHAPYTPDPEYKDMYSDVDIPVPQTSKREYFNRLPKFIRDSHAHLGVKDNGYWQRRYSTPEKYQQTMKKYYQLIAGVDAAVGRIREALKEQNLDDNTVIIFMGDNGEFESEHLLGGKALLREESIRVPLIVYDPRLPDQQRGGKRDELALNIDIAPTILSLAGLPVPASVHGLDMMSLLTGGDDTWRDDFFCENNFMLDHRNKSPQIYPMCECVRAERFKYIRYTDQRPVYEELFDLQLDPHETNNLAEDEQYRLTLNKLRERCDELVSIAGN